MKILHIITSLRTGGAEKLMVDLLPRMKKQGHEVDLCVFDGVSTPFYEELERRGIQILALHEEGGVYSLWNAFKLVKVMKGYDVVHAHNTPAQLCSAIANLFVRTRLLTTEHSTNNRRRGKWGMKFFDRWLYRQFECIICVSDKAAENIRNYVGTEHINVVTIPNGINTSDFEQAAADEKFMTEHAGKKCGLMVAGFRYEKDQKTVIRAYALLPEEYHLFLVGDGEKRNEIEALVTSLGLNERVHLLGVRGDVKNLLKSVDVVIMSSHREGLSLSSLEGMACGHPFIASDVEGLREIVGGYGVLFPHENEKVLSDVIRQLCEDESYAEKISTKCQLRAKMFDIEVMVTRYMHLYH